MRTLIRTTLLATQLVSAVAHAEPEVVERPSTRGSEGVPDDGKSPRARVYLVSPRDVTLEFRRGGDVTWTRVCDSPCDEVLALDGDFRVTGRYMRTSEVFTILRGKEIVTVNVAPASTAARTMGILGIVTGAVTSGLAFFAYQGAQMSASVSSIGCGLGSAASIGSGESSQSCSGAGETDYVVAGIVGGAMFIAGLAGVIEHARGTRVTGSSVVPIREPARARDVAHDPGGVTAMKRERTLRSAPSVPILQFSF